MPSPEQMKGIMDAWMAWSNSLGTGMVDIGSMLGGGQRVTATGSQPSTHNVSGYTMIQAADMAAAIQMMKGVPIMDQPDSYYEVHETHTM